MYGKAIEAEARRVCEALGVDHAKLRLEDGGALGPVIGARVESALRRAGVSGGDARPERTILPGEPTRRDRLRRSRLYLPGDQPKLSVNAGLHRPDGVILDLEDSVHPNHKSAARLVVRNLLRTMDFMGAERMVRINPLPLGLDDLDAIAPEDPDVILIPKVEDAETIRTVDGRIRQLTERRVWLMPILETALGIERAFDIACAADRVVALTIGLEDYTADLGVIKTVEGTESSFARNRLINAARAAGCQPIDSVYGDVGDEAGLRSWASRARALGFEGMGCVHPRQIRPIHEAFAPSTVEVEKALRVVAAFEDAEAKGLGVVSLGSKMIDPPVVKRALRTVQIARRAGLLEEVSDG
jgi:citrate lyase subunit beta/citryl-CoA lyase